MEEVAGFEDRLAGLKERGDHLVQGCSDRVQSRLRQQVQAHQQGTRDSYSAICSTAQRVSEVEEEMEIGREGTQKRMTREGWEAEMCSVFKVVKWFLSICNTLDAQTFAHASMDKTTHACTDTHSAYQSNNIPTA